MPPTALRAPRGERRGLLVLTVGAGAVLLRALPHRPGGLVPMCLNARGSSCSFRASPRGTGRLDDDEADGTQLGSTQAWRAGSRPGITAGLSGNRRQTTTAQRASG